MTFEQGRSAVWARIDFDRNGPRIGGRRLLRKGPFGFTPLTSDELATTFSNLESSAVDIENLFATLTSIAVALNKGDIGLAAITAVRLRLPLLTSEAQRPGSDSISKASVDDPKHPGYPAGTADSKGGQFRPKEQAAGFDPKERAARLNRLADRKTFRSIARRVLSVKRVLKMFVKYVDAEAVQDIPILNDLVGAASMKDDFDLMLDMSQDLAESDAAITFVNKGPMELKDLQMSPSSPQSFRSFGEFKKIEIEKQFGPAGEGYDYHHIVEQGPNAALFTQEQLQSTENIIRIPRLLHEEVTSAYGTARQWGNEMMTPRAYLRGRSFKEQYEFGLKQLRDIGIIH